MSRHNRRPSGNVGGFNLLEVEGGHDTSDEGTKPVIKRGQPTPPASPAAKKTKLKKRQQDRAKKSAINKELEDETVVDDVVETNPVADVVKPTQEPQPPIPVTNGLQIGVSVDPHDAQTSALLEAAQIPTSEPTPIEVEQPDLRPSLRTPRSSYGGETDVTLSTSPALSSSDDDESVGPDDHTQVVTPVVTQTSSFAKPDHIDLSPQASLATLRESSPAPSFLTLTGPTSPRSPNGSRSRASGRKEAQVVAAANHGADHDPHKKRKAVIERTIWSLLMIFGFIALLLMGHVYMICLVFALQTIVFRELTALFDAGYKPSHPERPPSASRERRRAERNRYTKVVSWYFFAITNYFFYGETISYYFKYIVQSDVRFIPFARHHRLISFILYAVGFVGFVSTLQRNDLRRQFGLFAWTHMTLFLIVTCAHFMVDNILEGMIWFWIPASLVIMNDIAAYVCGMLFGRHQLIKLSPKKTVEGFVGAFFITIIFAYIWATIFMTYPYLICPARNLGKSAFSDWQCEPNSVFIFRNLPLPQVLATPLSALFDRPVTTLKWAPFQLHAIVLGVFASLVAPYGGFFASGFKRAFNIKDFGDSIPGHGGLTDRFDCQFMMGLFSYVWYTSLIRENQVTVSQLLDNITRSLSKDQQLELLTALNNYVYAHR